MTFGKLNAILGLIASASVIYYIVSRLNEASAPIPTVVSISNLSREPITVDELGIAGGRLNAAPFSLPGRSGEEAGAIWQSSAIDLAPGRSIEVQARIQGMHPITASCQLDQRPPGPCVVQVSHQGGTDLKCDYVCESNREPER